MKIAFMGTPEFAVAPLKALCENGYDVVGVFTQPDKPVGRKAVLTPPPVKVAALERGIEVFQPETLKNGVGTELLKKLEPDLVVVVAYGKILPKDFLSYPRYGCINIHGSLLPKYRGAAPIQRCVLNGEEYAGITSMQMDEGLDTGDMLLCERLKIGENETSGELYERLAPLGAEVLLKTLEELENGTLKPQKQDDEESTYAKMLDKTMSPVNWSDTTASIHNTIRGLDPWPVATATFEGKKLKLFKSEITGEHSEKLPGTAFSSAEGLKAVCGDGGVILIKEVQFEGKKRMNATDFLRGHSIKGDITLQN